MTTRDPIPPGYDELGTYVEDELEFDDGEMIKIAEKGIDAFRAALEDSTDVITDIVTYQNIPHHNSTRTPAITLVLRGRRLSNLTISVPRKGESTAIRIDAVDEDNPSRRYTFSEITDTPDDQADDGYGISNGFEITDSDWVNAEKVGMGIDSFMENHEIATWLYRQAGLSYEDIARKLKTETDPVQDAAHALGQRATNVISQRQVKVNIGNGLQFYGEEIGAQTPDEINLQKPDSAFPTARPTRVYNLWANLIHDTDAYGGILERISCSFSPDNPALLVPNPRTHLSMSIQTTQRLSPQETSDLYAERRNLYRGNIDGIFEMIGTLIRNKRKSEPKPESL